MPYISSGNKLVGLIVSENVFQAQDTARRLKQYAYDPRVFNHKGSTIPPDIVELHSHLQRALSGNKLKNMREMAAHYIPGMVSGNAVGNGFRHLPPMTFYSQEKLDIEMLSEVQGVGLANIDEEMIALDGETQLAAWFQYLEDMRMRGEKVPDWNVSFTIIHGIKPSDALQVFFDMNTKAVNIPKLDQITKDTRDPVSKFLRDILPRWPALHMQVGPKFIHTLARSICGGRAYVYNRRLSVSEEAFTLHQNELSEVCTMLDTAVKHLASPAALKNDMLFTHIVLGVMGAELHDNPNVTLATIREIIQDVNWVKGSHWVGCGLHEKNGKTGNYSLSGSTGAAVGMTREALFDKNSTFYQKIRTRIAA